MTLNSRLLMGLFAALLVGCPNIQKFQCDPVTKIDCEPIENDDGGTDGVHDDAGVGDDSGITSDGGTEIDGGDNAPNTCEVCAPVAHGKAQCVDGGCVRRCDDGTLPVGGACEVPISSMVTVNSVCVLTKSGSVGCSGGANWLRTKKVELRLIPWPLPAPIKKLTGSKGSVCGISVQGDAWCWGYNNDGTLGNGTTNSFDAEPTAVLGGPFRAVSPGLLMSCGIRSDGGAACWGRNTESGFPLGYASSETLVPTPRDVSFQIGELIELSTVHYSTWARNRAGEIYAWGTRTDLENDPGPGTQPSARRLEFSFPVHSLDLGGATSFVIDTDGGVWVWGYPGSPRQNLVFNADGGERLVVRQPIPTTCPPHVVQLCQGGSHACVRTAAGEVWCWGDNTYGQLGDGTFQSRLEPKPVPDLVAGHLSCMESLNCATTTEGVKCWGQNSVSHLGSSVPDKIATPTFILTAHD